MESTLPNFPLLSPAVEDGDNEHGDDFDAMPPKLGMAMGIMMSEPRPVEVRMGAAEVIRHGRTRRWVAITEASCTSRRISLFRVLNFHL